MEDKFNGDFRTGRKHLNDAKLRHEEFLAVLALMFWTTGMAIVSSFYMSFTCTDQSGKRVREDKISSDALVFVSDGLPVSEIASKHSKTSRAAVLRELHSYFRLVFRQFKQQL